MAKWMWIIAGPNGAGKSTFTNDLLANAPALLKLNADERTAILRAADLNAPLRDLNLQAARDRRGGRRLHCQRAQLSDRDCAVV